MSFTTIRLPSELKKQLRLSASNLNIPMHTYVAGLYHPGELSYKPRLTQVAWSYIRVRTELLIELRNTAIRDDVQTYQVIEALYDNVRS